MAGDGVVAHRRVGDQHPQVADRCGQIPETHHHALHRLRCLAVSELQTGRRHQHLAKRQQGVRQDLPQDRQWIARIHHHLQTTDGNPRQAAEGDSGGHAAQRGRLDAELAQGRIQHEVVEGNQQHHQQRIQRLHLRGHEPVRLAHRITLDHPGRCLLIEQRMERRDQRENHQHAQHAAHAINGGIGMLASRAFELQPGTTAHTGNQQHQCKAGGNHETELRNHQQGSQRCDHTDDRQHQTWTTTPCHARQQCRAQNA